MDCQFIVKCDQFKNEKKSGEKHFYVKKYETNQPTQNSCACANQ